MNRRWAPILLVMGAAASPLAAQSSLSVIPVAGYLLPSGNWTDDDTISLKPGGGIFVGLVAEYGLNKNLSFMFQGTRTLGLTQTLTFESNVFFGSGTSLETDMTTTQLAAGIILRPLGRLPSGAPKTVYLELGGGMMLYDVSTGFANPSGASSQELDFNSSTPMFMGGVGLSFPAGPRASVQVFGRVNYQVSKYESQGLDDWNALAPPTTSEGKSSLVFQFGAGLRIGR